MRPLLPLATIALALATSAPALGQEQSAPPTAPASGANAADGDSDAARGDAEAHDRSPGAAAGAPAPTSRGSDPTDGDANAMDGDGRGGAEPSDGPAEPAGPTAGTSREGPDERRPKVAIVIRGDADTELRAAATRLEEALEGAVRLPSDDALRAALRGEGADDGLDGVRTRRRSLGLGDDEATLRALARLVGADALVVIHEDAGAPHLEVFDARAGRFFRERLPVQPLDASARFVARAARAAHRRARTSAVPSPVAAAEAGEAARAPGASEPEARETDALPPARAFFKKNWAYFVAGALLVGVVTFFVVRGRRDDDAPLPVLRFRPGPVE